MKRTATPTAELLARLEVAQHELQLAERVLSDAAIDDVSRRELRRGIALSRREVQRLIDWLSNARLEEPRN
jgi:hypothetical protein